MGFFKDVRALREMNRDIRRDFSPSQRLRETTARMRQVEDALVAQTSRASIATTGVAATAQVLATRDAGVHLNLQPMLEIDLLVTRDGEPPYPVTIRQVVPTPMLMRLAPGSVLPARVDPTMGTAVLVGF